MKKIISIMALAVGLTAGLHAVQTYDASGNTDNVSSISFNANGTSGTYLVVGVVMDGANQPGILDVTYAGTGMNQGTSTYTLTSTMYEFYLAAPAAGANNIVLVRV